MLIYINSNKISNPHQTSMPHPLKLKIDAYYSSIILNAISLQNWTYYAGIIIKTSLIMSWHSVIHGLSVQYLDQAREYCDSN